MPTIQISIEDTSFSEVIKRQAQGLIENNLHYYSLFEYATIETENQGEIFFDLKTELKKYFNKVDKTLFITELLIHLGDVREIFIKDFESNQKCFVLLDDITYFLFRELEKLKVGVDKNAFTNSEIKNIRSKINFITKELNKIQLGQEIIFDKMESLKQDLIDILISFGLGKKPFYQRLAGVFATYAGEKGADEVYAILKPYIKAAFANSTKLMP